MTNRRAPVAVRTLGVLVLLAHTRNASAMEPVVTARGCAGVDSHAMERLLAIELGDLPTKTDGGEIRVELECADDAVTTLIYLPLGPTPWARTLHMPASGAMRSAALALSISEAVRSARADEEGRAIATRSDVALPAVDLRVPAAHGAEVYAEVAAGLAVRGVRRNPVLEKGVDLRVGASGATYEIFGVLSVRQAQVGRRSGDVSMQSARAGVGFGAHARIAGDLALRTAWTISALALRGSGAPASDSQWSQGAEAAHGLGASATLSVGGSYRTKRVHVGVDVTGDLVVPSFVARVVAEPSVVLSGFAIGAMVSVRYEMASL